MAGWARAPSGTLGREGLFLMALVTGRQGVVFEQRIQFAIGQRDSSGLEPGFIACINRQTRPVDCVETLGCTDIGAWTFVDEHRARAGKTARRQDGGRGQRAEKHVVPAEKMPVMPEKLRLVLQKTGAIATEIAAVTDKMHHVFNRVDGLQA